MSSAMLIQGLAGTEPVVLERGATAHVVVSIETGQLAAVLSLDPGVYSELGRITSESFGAKLEATDGTLRILPGQLPNPLVSSTNLDGLRPEEYELRAKQKGRVEVLILRHGDLITCPPAEGSLVCKPTASDVQVDSSAAVIEPARHQTDIAVTPEDDETDNEPESLEQVFTAVPVTQPKSQPSATPRLSHQVSVVHETPTAVRTTAAPASNESADKFRSPSNVPPPTEAMDTGETGFSTAPTGRSQLDDMPLDVAKAEDSPESARKTRRRGSPKVRISPRTSKKRPQPVSGADPLEPDTEQSDTSKRPRTSIFGGDDKIETSKHPRGSIFGGDDKSENGQNNGLIDTPNKTRPSRGKKRLSEAAEASPMRTTRNSSQQSATNTATEVYEGPPLHIVFSNSAIEKHGPAMKFLKRNKGTVAESVEKDCNVLCTRDGILVKTTKIVQAIARGIPIVSDKWLQESAGAGRFLEFSAYKPSFPDQEKEWKFNFTAIWNKPQNIFEGYTIYFTPDFKDKVQYKSVCLAAGASVTGSKKQAYNADTIVIAKEEGDNGADEILQKGTACYTKDLLTTSILRGKVELSSDEFKIGAGDLTSETEVATKKKRTRKTT